jgi:hypothetical protein
LSVVANQIDTMIEDAKIESQKKIKNLSNSNAEKILDAGANNKENVVLLQVGK